MLEAAVFDTKAQDCLPGQYQRQSKFGDDDITVRVGADPALHSRGSIRGFGISDSASLCRTEGVNYGQ